VSGYYSPSSSPIKKTPDATAKTSHTALTAAHRNDKAKTDGEHCRNYQADYRNQRDLHHLLSPLELAAKLAANMQ
jgi:hypothetical protein